MPCGTSRDQSERMRATTPAPPSHLRLVTLTGLMTPGREKDYLGPMWTLSLRSVLTFVASGLDTMAVCCIILRGQHIYTVIQAVYSLVYFVAKCHFFSVVTGKGILKYL